MTGISLPSDATKANLDSGSDAVKNARTELASLVDKFNTLKGEIGSDRLQWPIELPDVTYASATSFTVSDATGCHVGRRVQIVGTTTGTVYGTISDVTGTTITVDFDSGTLSSESLQAWLGLLSFENSSIPVQSALAQPNYCWNGNFDIWQRDTSFSSFAARNGVADGWTFSRSSLAAGATVSQQSGSRGSNYCIRVRRDDVDAKDHVRRCEMRRRAEVLAVDVDGGEELEVVGHGQNPRSPRRTSPTS